MICRFVVESTVEENVQRLSSQRAAAMDLSAASSVRGKQSSQQDPLTVRCAVLCGAVWCCAVLCCAVMCCAVLCCGVLCCAVLCCAVMCSSGV